MKYEPRNISAAKIRLSCQLAGKKRKKKNMNTISNPSHVAAGSISKSYISLHYFPQTSSTKAAASRRYDYAPITKRSQKSPKRLIKISTADGKWQGKWNLEYIVSLHDLQLQDLTEDDDTSNNNEVSIALNIQKHTGFGLSVDGKIVTIFTSKCINCTALYSKEISTNFNVWVLPSSKQRSSENELPEIGGDDPSVIYVKPGCEAELDTLIQDTVRLAISVKGTCSDTCEKSEPKLEYLGAKHTASIDKRWSRLLQLRKELG